MIEYWIIEEYTGDNWKIIRHVLDLEAAVRQVAGMKAYEDREKSSPFPTSNINKKERTSYRIRNSQTNEVIDDAIIV